VREQSLHAETVRFGSARGRTHLHHVGQIRHSPPALTLDVSAAAAAGGQLTPMAMAATKTSPLNLLNIVSPLNSDINTVLAPAFTGLLTNGQSLLANG
jgi:hypothetical protein